MNPGRAVRCRRIPCHAARKRLAGPGGISQVDNFQAVAGLFQPTGLAVGSHGAVYVSNFGSSTATAARPGEILKITGLS